MVREKIIITIAVLLIVANAFNHAFAQGEIATVKYTSGGLRDPLKNILKEEKVSPVLEPVEEEVIYLPPLYVQGMVWGVEPVKAIINNQVVGKGDVILEVQVLDIKKDGVYLLYKGEQFVIRP